MRIAGSTISTSSRAPDTGAAGRIAAAGLIYLGVTLLCVGVPRDFTQVLLGIGDDPKSFVWYLEWWPWAIAHGRNPFWSHLVFAPGGYSMAWGTSVPTAALLAAPVTAVAGPVAAFNVLTLTARPLAALAGYLLAREATGGFAAAVVAGWLFGFSGYENGQALGHLNLDLVFLLPVVAWLFVRRVRGRIGRRGFVVGLACVLLAQFGLSTEILATTLVMGSFAVALFAALGTADERRAIVRSEVEAAAAVGLAAAGALPMLLSMARGAADMPDFVNPASVYSNDLANLVVPTMAEAMRSSWTGALAGRFTGNAEEQDLYLGLPLLLMVVLFCAGRAPARRRAAWAVLLVGLVMASLGPVLHAGGRVLPVALPWALAGHLPLIRGALPCRIGVFATLAASVVAATWLQGGSRGRWLLAMAACAFLVPGSARTARTPVAIPCVFAPGTVGSLIDGGENVLVLPYGSGDSMLWQAAAGMRFRQAGGLLSLVPKRFGRDPLVLPLLRNEAMEGFGPALLAFGRRFGVAQVVAGPGTGRGLLDALNALKLPRRGACGVSVFALGGGRELQ